MHFFGIADGHGPFGGDVSTFLKNNLPVIVADTIEERASKNDSGEILNVQ
jgi:hypothetical protein